MSVRDAIVSFFSRQALFLSIITTDIALIGIVYGGGVFFHVSLSFFITGFILFLSIIWLILVYKKYFQIPLLAQISEIHIPILSLLLLLWYFLQDGPISFSYSLSFLSTTAFFLVFLFQTEMSFVKKQLYGIFIWLVLYINFLVWFVCIFQNISWQGITTFLFLYSVLFFELVSLPKFKIYRESIRAISLLWLYISTLSYFFLLFQTSSYWIVLFLLLSLAFNVYVHARFENYPSLVFSTIIPVPIYYFFFWISETFWTFLISSVCITLWLTFFWRIVRTANRRDEYVFQTVAILVLVWNTISFGWRVGIINIFQYSVILLMFSFLTFVSYLQIRK